MTTKRKSLGQIAGRKDVKPDPNVVDEILNTVKAGAGEGEPKAKPAAPAPPAATEPAPVATYKLTAMVDKELFRKMKVYCVSSDITIRQFLERAIKDQLSG